MFDVFVQTAIDMLWRNPIQLLAILIGTIWGIIFGAMPGLSTTMSLAILIPLTFGYDANIAISLLIAAYTAGVYGGCLSAITINIPGTPSALATTFDGYPLAKKGEAGRAIGFATIASGIGGLIGWGFLVFLSPILSNVALKFSSQEFVAISLFGIIIIAYISPGSTFYGLIAGIFGLLLGTSGIDLITGVPRFDFGRPELLEGLPLVPISIGLFGFNQVLYEIENYFTRYTIIDKIEDVLPKWKEILTHFALIVKSSIIGVIVGIIPAAGDSVSTMVAYAQGKMSSKYPEKWGTGIIEGVIAPESANNGGVGGAIIPMISLGIPGDAMTAVLLGGLIIHGIRPGPLLIKDNPGFVFSIFNSLLIAIVFTTIIGLLIAKQAGKLLSVPKYYTLPVITIMCIIGAYSYHSSIFEINLMLLFGLIGYTMKKLKFPIAPVVLGRVLSPIFEDNFRRSLTITRGDIFTFFKRPISLIFIIIAIFVVVYPYLKSFINSRKIYNNSI